MSSDSGVVSPAENVDDHQLLLQQQKQQQQQQEKKKSDVDGQNNNYQNRKHSDRQASGGSSKLSGKQFSNLPSCNSSDSGQGSEPSDGFRFTFHFNVPSELTGKF